MQSNVAELPVSHRLLAWFETNKKPTITAAVVIAVVALVAWFISWNRNQKELAASEVLSAVTVQQMTTPGGHLNAARDYLEVAARFPDSMAGVRAQLMAAGALFSQGNYTEAQAQFEKFAREHHDSPFMGEAQLGIAACLDAQGKNDAAIAAYKDLLNRHPSENVAPQARFALGRLYEQQNKPELARDEFAEVEREDRQGSMGMEAGMRIEELIAKYPKLAPSTELLTNAPIKIEKNK